MITLRKSDLKHVNDLSVNNGVLCLDKFIDSKQAKTSKAIDFKKHKQTSYHNWSKFIQ